MARSLRFLLLCGLLLAAVTSASKGDDGPRSAVESKGSSASKNDVAGPPFKDDKDGKVGKVAKDEDDNDANDEENDKSQQWKSSGDRPKSDWMCGATKAPWCSFSPSAGKNTTRGWVTKDGEKRMQIIGEGLYDYVEDLANKTGISISDMVQVKFKGKKNVFGGLENKGRCDFSGGDSEFESALNSTGFLNVSSDASLTFKFKTKTKHHIGGYGCIAKGKLIFAPGSEMELEGALMLLGAGKLNITTGAVVHFIKALYGSTHWVGGEGIDSRGELYFDSGETDFAASLTSGLKQWNGTDFEDDKDDNSSITSAPGSSLVFVEMTDDMDDKKHFIGGGGMNHWGNMSVGRGHSFDAKRFFNNGQMRFRGRGVAMRVRNFLQNHSEATFLLDDGALFQANSSEALRFWGGLVGGTWGKIKGSCEFRRHAKIVIGDHDDNEKRGRSNLTIDGNLDLDNTTVTAVALSSHSDGGEVSADSLHITGTVKLGNSSLSLDISNNRPKVSTTITVLTATGGITGKYGNLEGLGPNDQVRYVRLPLKADGSVDTDASSSDTLRRLTGTANAVQVDVAGGSSGDALLFVGVGVGVAAAFVGASVLVWHQKKSAQTSSDLAVAGVNPGTVQMEDASAV